MGLFILFALMTAAAIFAVLFPLGRDTREPRGGTETAVYRDQLAELSRNVAAGSVGSIEAEAARIEIGRRLIAASESEPASLRASLNWRRVVAVCAIVVLPLVAAVFYLPLGSPALPDFPLASRQQAPTVNDPLEKLVAKVERQLEKNPNDGRGWEVVAPVLMRLERYDDAVRAYRSSIALNGETASRRADLGEALTGAANGVVTSEAREEFERAVALDANEVKARYFTGVAAEQDGRGRDAAMIWQAMLASAPSEAPWRPLVQAALSRVGTVAPVLSDDTIAAAKDMSEGDRNAMIRGMVDRLSQRLKTETADVDGWVRLVRAYIVLGDTDKAKAAMSEARAASNGDTARLQRLNDGLRGLGLDG